MSTIRIQSEVFDAGAELRALRGARCDIGAVVCFEGVCRDSRQEQGTASAAVQAMELEHYPGMTEKSIAAMVAEAQSRWSLLGVTVIHRVGRLLPGALNRETNKSFFIGKPLRVVVQGGSARCRSDWG